MVTYSGDFISKVYSSHIDTSMFRPVLLLLCLLVSPGCIVVGPPVPEWSAEARQVWRDLGGSPSMPIDAVPVIGSPAVWAWGGPMTIGVPVGLPPGLRRAAMRYEVAKAHFVVHGPGGQTLAPLRYIEALLHGPISETASWVAVLRGIGIDDRRRRAAASEMPMTHRSGSASHWHIAPVDADDAGLWMVALAALVVGLLVSWWDG